MEGFTDEALRRLCYDNREFRPVYEQLAQEMSKDRIIDKLIEHAERKDLMETLLAVAKELNSARYEKHQPYEDAGIELTTAPTTIASSVKRPIETFINSPAPKLTSRQRQSLEAERAGLQRRYDLLNQKIQRLGEALDIETDPATRFKLEIQLQQAKADRDPISRELTDLDSKLDE